MKVQDTVLDGVKIIEPVVYGDNRVFFRSISKTTLSKFIKYRI